jgi:RNA polymerase sigma factor (sigma-70 family)
VITLALERAIEALPRRERLVFVLHDCADVPLRDLGAMLGVSRARAWQLRQRALERLRAALGEEA